MPKTNIIQPSFAGGEATEALQGREDLAKQHVAALTCRNGVISSTGTFKNRGGLKYIAEVKASSKIHRLMPFTFSRIDSYAVVWGDENARFIKNGAIIENPPSTPVEIVTPYGSAQLATLYEAQSADVMYLTNEGHSPNKLTRTSDIAWTIDEIDFEDGPYLAFQDGDELITLTPSAKTGSVTITASDSDAFDGVEIDDHIRLGFPNPLNTSQVYWAWCVVTATPTSTTRVVTVEKDFGFEYFLNPDFEEGIAFWPNHSVPILSNDAVVEHVKETQELRMIRTVDNVLVRNNITVNAYEDLVLELIVTEVTTTSLLVDVGTSAGAQDILATKTITTPGTYTYTVHPAQASIWVNLHLNTPGTAKISNMSLKRKDLATNQWRVRAWSATRGWPRAVTLHKQSVFYAGGHIDNADTFWKTKSGEYEKLPFNTPPLDTDAISQQLSSAQVNAIEWIVAHGELMIGTSNEEWRVTPGPVGNTITPTSIDANSKSKTGSAFMKPVIANKSLLFLSRNRDKIYALPYSLDADAYDPDDLTKLAPHLFEGYQILEWAYQKTPDSLVWCIRDDGVALSLSYNEKQDLWAWSRHDTDGLFESVCVVPESTGDTVYFIVNRTIGVATKRFIEQLQPRIADGGIYDYSALDSEVVLNTPITITGISNAATAVVDAPSHGLSDGDIIKIDNVFTRTAIVDDEEVIVAGMPEVNGNYYKVANKNPNDFELNTQFGDPTPINSTNFGVYVSGGEVRKTVTTMTGLAHLNGETVIAIVDGSKNTPKVVAGGSIALDNPGAVVHVGLPYYADLKTIPHDFVADGGQTSQGKDKQLFNTNIYFNKTRAARVGSDEDNLEEISFNEPDQGNKPPALFTGVKENGISASQNKLIHTFIRSDPGLPMEVVGLISEVGYEENK